MIAVLCSRSMQARREFLKGVAGAMALQMGPPKQVKVISSVMLWALKGSFEEKVAAAAQAGLQAVELVDEQTAWSDAEVAKYKRLLESYRLRPDTVVGQREWTTRPVTMVNPAHREGFLQDVKAAIQWAKKLDVPEVILLSGNEQPGLSREQQYASLVEGAKRATDLAVAGEMTLILENLNSKIDHKGYFLTSAREALRAAKEVGNPHFRLLFDIYHEDVQNGDPIPAMKDADPYTAVYHVADAPGRHDPGTGAMKWHEIYKAIGKSGYAGYLTFEYLPLGDQVESLIKAVTEMRKDVNGPRVQS